jgi:hypothetical protein
MNYFDNMTAAYGDTIYDGHMFIGFRVEKGLGGSETFTNNTGESELAQQINAQFDTGNEARYELADGNTGTGLIDGLITGIMSAASAAISTATSSVSMDSLAATATGAVRIDIPDVWMSSSYSRSASFSITALAPYGDPETILQSEYVPLACLLAGVIPRGTGSSSYSAPFVCQAYCRGYFSSPLCIIESMTITRGADQFGMNMARQPLKTTFQISLKDLSPVMYMNMGGDSNFLKQIFGADDNFGEYLCMLAGMGLRERLSPYRAMRRKAIAYMATLHNARLSPYNLGMDAGQFRVSRLISEIVSGGKGIPVN